MTDDYVVGNVLDKIEEIIGIEKIEDTQLLINTENKLPNETNFKKVVILLTCVIKDGSKFYPQPFLDHALYDE